MNSPSVSLLVVDPLRKSTYVRFCILEAATVFLYTSSIFRFLQKPATLAPGASSREEDCFAVKASTLLRHTPCAI
jgi:hypothetical protein